MTRSKNEGVATRRFGRAEERVSMMGLGGHAIGKMRLQKDAIELVRKALDAGVTFMDNAHEYHDGRSEEIMGKALNGRRDEAFLMTKTCSHGRDGKVAMRQLEESLKRLQTDHLDLWQIHEVIHDNDPDLHFARGGAVEALEKAKQQGKTRYVGFTGHKDPAIHLKMLAHDFPFDAVQMPLNPLDGTFRSFESLVLPELVARGISVLAMKSLNGSGQVVKDGVMSVSEALGYVLSLPVTTLISGIDSLRVLRQNLRIVRAFEPMNASARRALRERCREVAADGHYELYKVSKIVDGDPGRKQHGFPLQAELGG